MARLYANKNFPHHVAVKHQVNSDKYEHVILNEARVKNLLEKPQKQDKGVLYGDSSSLRFSE